MINVSFHKCSCALALSLALVAPSFALAEKVLRRANDLSYGGSESLDPLSPSRFYEVTDLIYNRLIRPTADGGTAPELALTWVPNETAMEWTLTLRSGVRFHDGSDFEAADVKYSLERINDPALESPVASVLGIISSVDVIDPLTVKINLSAPHAGLPLLLYDYRVRMIPNGSGDMIASSCIGTGPFMLESFDAESMTQLVANPNYWDGAPKLDRISFTAIADQEARNHAMLAGQLDLNSLSRDQEPFYKDNPAFTLQNFPVGDWFGIAFLSDEGALTDPRVRKALRIAVDRQEMMNLLAGAGNAELTCDNPVKKSDPFRADISCPQDITGAKALLAEAGYPDGIDIELYTSDLEPGMLQFSEVYQQQVAKAGIRIDLKVATADGYWDNVWFYKNAMTSWGERPADQWLNEVYRTGADWNESHYANPAFDALLDEARSTLDQARARDLYVKAQEMLFEEGSTFIPYQENGRRVMSSKVTGIAPVGEDFIDWHLVDMAK